MNTKYKSDSFFTSCRAIGEVLDKVTPELQTVIINYMSDLEDQIPYSPCVDSKFNWIAQVHLPTAFTRVSCKGTLRLRIKELERNKTDLNAYWVAIDIFSKM